MKVVVLSKKHFYITGSDQFLIDLLSEEAEVVVFRREESSSWKLFRKIRHEKPDLLIFFATPPSFFHHILRFIMTPKIFVPMYDGFKPFKPLKEKLFRFFGLKALCFSSPMTEYHTKIGLKTLSVRYFPKPLRKDFRAPKGPYTFLFWQRSKENSLLLIRSVVGDENIHKVIYRSEFQEDAPFLERLDKWLSKEELQELLQKVDFVIAPRRQEGIGMAFLEALAVGTSVIAYDDYTMKDYITPGLNGHLFKTDRITITPPNDLTAINEAFYKRWLEDRLKIKSFMGF
ncbi:MAG: glycosyltransferase [Chlamydiae bacterium]|nr:glycosyltransferase [Chlamydiota bacterium]